MQATAFCPAPEYRTEPAAACYVAGMGSQNRSPPASIEIPGETTLWKTVDIAPERVTLPFVAGPHVMGQSIAAGALLVAGLPTVAAAAILLSQFLLLSGQAALVVFVIGVLLGVIGAWLTTKGIVGILNLVRRSPLLVIDETGLWGARLRDPIRWTDIKRAKIIVRRKSGITGVSLRLRHPIAPRRGFQFRGWLERFFGEPDLVYVPVTLLDRSRHTLSHAIIRMAEKHGAEIVPPDS